MTDVVSYTPPGPIAEAFLLDRSFISGIRGPVGSGKSSVACWKMVITALQQAPYNGTRYSRWAVLRNCYDDQTEILTELRGFKLFADLLPDDRVATLQDEKIVYVRPDGVSVSDYDGEMIGFEGEGVDFLVTPDHEMWVSKCRTRARVYGEFEMLHAADIYGSTMYRVRRDAGWIGESALTEDEFELVGYWYAEGSRGTCGGKDRIVVTGVNDVAYARDLFVRAGVAVVEWKRNRGINFVFDGPSCIDHLLSGRSSTKTVHQEVKDASSGHIAAFLRGFSAGDGHVRKEGTTTLYTSSKDMADGLQELALKAGIAANVSSRDRRGNAVKIGSASGVVNHVEYTVTLLCQKRLRPKLVKQKGRYRGWYKQPYSGKVYCAEMDVPVVFVRRNGRAFWCRRTYPELKSTTIKTWQDWFPDSVAPFKWDTPISSRLQIPDIGDGTALNMEVMFFAMDRPEDAGKLRGLELTGAWLNEASELDKSVLDILTQRVGRYPAERRGGQTWSGVIMDTNSPDDDSWWYRFAEEESPQGWKFFSQPGALYLEDGQYKPNPHAENIQNIKIGYEYYLRMLAGKSDDWIKVFVLNQYGSTLSGKPVYPEWRESFHLAKAPLQPIMGLPLILGWDFGLCYSDDTEVLTENGWKLFANVADGEKVATRNPATGAMEFHVPAFKVDQPYEGEMLEWDSCEVSMLVTPEHLVACREDHKPNELQWKSAEWLAQHNTGHWRVDLKSSSPMPANWVDPMHFGMSAKAFAEFMGLYLSEGCVDARGNSHRIFVYQKDRDPQMQSMLDATGMPWKWFSHGKTSGWRVTDNNIGPWLAGLGGAHTKRIPREVATLPPEFLSCFVDAYTDGDGHIRTRANGAVEHTIFTVSERMAGDFQEAAQKLGWSSSVRRREARISHIVEGNTVRAISNDGGYDITFKKGAHTAGLHARHFRRVPYKGRVYCFNVPYHTMYVRRNGLAHWNGNTPACAVFQITPRGQLIMLREFVSEDMGIRQFANDVVRPALFNEFPRHRIESVGDPAGTQRAQTDEKTCLQELFEAGIPTEPAPTNEFVARREAVAFWLTRNVGGDPAFLVDPSCKQTRKGFNGGYCYARINASGGSRHKDRPDKNQFSHIHDAIQYAALRVRSGLSPVRAVAVSKRSSKGWT